jgi:hypothetical protein
MDDMMEILLDNGKTFRFNENEMWSTLEASYKTWETIHRREPLNPQGIIMAASLEGDVGFAYRKSKFLREFMDCILGNAIRIDRDVAMYWRGEKKREDLKNSDGTMLGDYDLGLLELLNEKITIGGIVLDDD